MTIPDYVQEAFDAYKTAADNLRDFRSEVGNIIEKEEEMTREKTNARRVLDNSVLKYYNSDSSQRSFFDDSVSIHKDIVLEIVDESWALRAILAFCDNYQQTYSVDMRTAFLKILVGSLKEKLLADPAAFGLVDISNGEHDIHWISPGFEVKTVDKVTVTNKV
jgi:hypothetical protein